MPIRNSRILATMLLAATSLSGVGVQHASAQPGCSPSINPLQQGLPAAGGTGRITIALQPGCSWSAVSNDTSWLTVTSAATGTGTGLVTYQAPANTGAPRRTTISINNVLVVIDQPGDVNPENLSLLVADEGGNRLFQINDFSGRNWATGPLEIQGHTLNYPLHITRDSLGRIYIADQLNLRIIRMDDLTGKNFTTYSGQPGKPWGVLRSVTLDSQGRLYIGGTDYGLIRVDDMSGTNYVSFLNSNQADDMTGFCNAKVAAFDSLGRIYVTDTDHYRIVRMDDMTGKNFVAYGTKTIHCGPAQTTVGGNGVGEFNRPEGITLDSSGRIYITDNENDRIVRINDMTGAGWTTFATHGSGVNQLIFPHDIQVSPAGKIYIADTGNGRVVRIEDMTGAGWTTYGVRPNQLYGIPAFGTIGIPPGFGELVAPKGLTFIPPITSPPCTFGISPGHITIAGAGGSGNMTVTAGAGCQWIAATNQSWLTITSAVPATGAGTFTYSAAKNTSPTPRTAVVTVGGYGIYITQEGVPAATMSADRTALVFGAGVPAAGGSFPFKTGAQSVRLTQSGAGTVGWIATSVPQWISVSSFFGTGTSTLGIDIKPSSALPASGPWTEPILVTLYGATTTTLTINVTVNLISTQSTTAPFGSLDTPANNATGVAGSVAVTGWALDDVGIDRVEIWRDLQTGETTAPFSGVSSDPRNGKVFISNATFVDSARPDIEGAYPGSPLNYRAGWGYLLLTWGLWNQGNGTYVLYAFAFDKEGNVSTLGKKTVGVDNAHATKPFGSIDTPGIGATASGSVTNFGWALTPNNGGTTCKVPPAGVQVSLDSGPLQPVAYGDARSDIAGAFTGFTNSNAAGGHFVVDTTALTNGAHTIGWFVTDDCTRADGVGSRFFSVQNGTVTTGAAATSHVAAPAEGLRWADASVTVAKGYGELPGPLEADAAGVRTVTIRQGERLEIRLPPGHGAAYQSVNGNRRALPLGSTWNAASGIFSWQPAPGFLGRFELAFESAERTVYLEIVIGPF
jgi:hypothetical protein